MTPLEKTETHFNDMLEIIVNAAKGGKFDNSRIDAAKTVINTYGKLNQTESAKRTNQLIAIKMVSRDRNEERELVASSGLLNDNVVKKLK